MAKETLRRIKLSEELLPLVGNAPDDIVMTLVVAAQVLEPLYSKVETAFSAEEWRALAHAAQVSTYKLNRDPGRRLDLDIEEVYGADQPDLVTGITQKTATLTPSERWVVLAIIDFAKRHFPTQLETEEWWTLATRDRVFRTQQQTSRDGKVRRTRRKMPDETLSMTKVHATS